MVKAFIFGKFLPFHKGHEAMIRFALAHCDFLSVLICCSDKESIPAEERFKWISHTFENQHNMEIRIFNYSEDALVNTSVASNEVSKSWATIFSRELPNHCLLITSEPYGPLVAGYMDIQHLTFDIKRQAVPISASAIRNDIFTNWEFLPLAVKPYFKRKVVILGTESTGKTTLATQLSQYYTCGLVSEIGREIIADSTSFDFDDLIFVAEKHAEKINCAMQGNGPLVIIDTDINITESYAAFIFGKELKIEGKIYESNNADLYLYLCNDVPYIQDGTRLVERDRNLLDISHRRVLEKNHITFVEINGTWEQRFDSAKMYIEMHLSTLA